MLKLIVRSFLVVLALVTCAPLLAQIPLPPLPPLPPVPRVPHVPSPPRVVPLPPLPDLDIQISTVAPPRRHHEVIPHRPSADHVWIGGMWHWQADHWIWMSGRWERPHVHGVWWVEPRYVRDGGYWRYEPGHWSDQHVREGDGYRRWKEEEHHDRGHDRHDDRDHHNDDRDRHENNYPDRH